MEKKVLYHAVTDLGVASYVKMHGFKCVGKKNRNWYFEVGEDDTNQFEQLKIDYINSPYHAFDHELMSLKKVGDYLPQGKDV
jgi:hypothetical protein